MMQKGKNDGAPKISNSKAVVGGPEIDPVVTKRVHRRPGYSCVWGQGTGRQAGLQLGFGGIEKIGWAWNEKSVSLNVLIVSSFLQMVIQMGMHECRVNTVSLLCHPDHHQQAPTYGYK